MRYMISYRYQGWMGISGNQTFDTPAEASEFVSRNSHAWQSHSVFTFDPTQVIAELAPATL